MKTAALCKPTEYRRILVPVDFSPPSRAALRQALMLAGNEPSRLEILHVSQPMHLDWRADNTKLQREFQEVSRKALAALIAEEFGNTKPRSHFATGKPAEVIVRHAIKTKPNLIVMGTHGRTGFKRILLGSVADRVVRHAPCGVMIVR